MGQTNVIRLSVEPGGPPLLRIEWRTATMKNADIKWGDRKIGKLPDREILRSGFVVYKVPGGAVKLRLKGRQILVTRGDQTVSNSAEPVVTPDQVSRGINLLDVLGITFLILAALAFAFLPPIGRVNAPGTGNLSISSRDGVAMGIAGIGALYLLLAFLADRNVAWARIVGTGLSFVLAGWMAYQVIALQMAFYHLWLALLVGFIAVVMLRRMFKGNGAM